MDDEARRLNDCRIGAADDLYNALNSMTKLAKLNGYWGDMIEKADGAIAKADGRT